MLQVRGNIPQQVERFKQAHAQGERRPPRKIFAPPTKDVGHSLKFLDTVQKIWAPLRKLLTPTVVPSWFRAWVQVLRGSIHEQRKAQQARLIAMDW